MSISSGTIPAGDIPVCEQMNQEEEAGYIPEASISEELLGNC